MIGEKNCHFLICKGTKSFLFPRHSFSYTCSRESSCGATFIFFWPSVKETDEKKKKQELTLAVIFMRTGKAFILQQVCHIAMLVPSTSRTHGTLPCSSLIPHGLTRYVHATQKYWICIIRWQAQPASFSLFPSFFRYVCGQSFLSRS